MMNFMFRWRLTPSAIRNLVTKPQNRRQPASVLIEGHGGKLLHYFFTFTDEECSGFAITEMPDGDHAAALTMAALATGGFESFTMTRIWTPEEAERIMQEAQKSKNYSPPGG
jgi:uncharacterized protein with GYD domain